MIKRINDVLVGLPATIAAGACLLIKLLLQYGFRADVPLYLDPAWIAVIITGIPLLYLAVWRIIYNPGISKISSALLICIGMAACIAMTFLTDHDELFAAGEIGFIMSIGAILEDKTTEHARSGLKKLISLNPAQGRKITGGKEETVPVEEIRVGDILRVNPGETIPVDGVIVNGSTSVNQSVMTGESLPVDKEIGDEVFCGTMNCFGSVDMRATKVGEEGSPQKLIRMVEDADKQKAPIARIADKAASWLVPVALLIAIVAFAITGNIEKGVTILVVFCPCALILATPTAVMAGIGQATKHGVIIKSGEALEKMGKADTIAFDKTDTLTYGRLTVSDVISFDETLTADELLSVTASAEMRSEHPLGKAVTAAAKARELDIPAAEAFSMESGKGVQALKTANIGVAMGSMGSDIAVEAADVALTSDDISKIPYLKKLSDATVRTIKLSISLSLVINAFAITFSLMGILNPTTGALWHNVGSCFVVLLAASLYDRKIV